MWPLEWELILPFCSTQVIRSEWLLAREEKEVPGKEGVKAVESFQGQVLTKLASSFGEGV